MRLDPRDIAFSEVTRTPESKTQGFSFLLDAEPTKYDRNHRTSIVINKPYDVFTKNERWLLDDGFYIRKAIVDYHGDYLDMASNEALHRYMMFTYLMSERDVVRISAIARIDQYRRWAVGDEGERYPTDVSLEALLTLACDGATAWAIRRYDEHTAYRVTNKHGETVAVSPTSERYQLWWSGLTASDKE